jgi:hypothetical protein
MGDVIDLNKFKKAKENIEGDKPTLYISHQTGKVTGSPKPSAKMEGSENRLERIRASLEKINRLMAELKELGDRHNVDNGPRQR